VLQKIFGINKYKIGEQFRTSYNMVLRYLYRSYCIVKTVNSETLSCAGRLVKMREIRSE
jgi:hypothetical protein